MAQSEAAPARKAARLAKKVISADDLLTATPKEVSADEEVSTSFTDLEPGCKYQAYFLLESAIDGAKSEMVTSEEFTTLRHFDPLTLAFDNDNVRINSGATATITAAVAGGEAPYTYEWRDQMNQVVSTEATLNVAPAYTYGYRLTVKSGDGQTATGKTKVLVTGETVAATFDDNYLAENTHFSGDTNNDMFYSGSFSFAVANMDSWWYGFGMSNSTSTEFKSLDDQFNSSVGSGVDGSSNYCVAYPSGTDVTVTSNEDGDIINGAFITNNAYAYSSMTKGDSFAKKFAKGDWFKLTVSGKTATGTNTLDFYLSDFRSENEADHYILNTWQWLDLRSLGKVQSLSFTFTSSDTGKYGMNTPAYFCMDNLGGVRPETAAERNVRVGDSNIALADLFNLESNGATVKYALEEVSTDGNITAAIDGDAISVNAAAGAKKVVVVSATQKGKTQYVRLTINVDASTYVGDVINPNAKVSVNGNTIKVSGAKSVNVFSTTGALISADADTIDVVAGVYLVVADGITHKVLVK